MGMRVAKPGMDKGKLGSDYEMSRDHDHEAQEEGLAPIVSFSELTDTLLQRLDAVGFRLYAVPNGTFCGFDVYRKSKLLIFGLQQPSDFHYMRRLEPSNTIDRSDFIKAVRKVCDDERQQNASKKVQAKWEAVALNFEDRASDPRGDIFRIAQSRIGLSPRKATLSGRSGFHKVVPPLEWFPVALQQFNPRKLLTLLPDAEADQLMLILGRVLAGANGTEVAEGTLEHTFRSYGVIVGTEAGMGKSTLLNYITGALEKLGYSATQLNSDFNKFGWGSIAVSDLATIDDLTDDVQRKMLQDNRVKSIVSNNWLKVEEKGMPAVDVRSVTVLLGCTNMTNYSHYIGMDSGSLSRLNQLDTYTTHELEMARGTDRDYRIKPYWEALATELNTTTEVLATRLLREALDYFLMVSGHTLADGCLRKDIDSDVLEYQVKANRDRFRIDVSLSHAKELPSAASHLVALALADAGNDRKRESLYKGLQKLDFSPDLLLTLVGLFVDIQEPKEGYQGLHLYHLSHDCRKYLKAKLGDLQTLSLTKSVEGAFGVIVSELKSCKGFGYPSKSSHYQAEWLAAKRLIPSLVKQYETQLEVSPPDSAIQAALSEITTQLLSLSL